MVIAWNELEALLVCMCQSVLCCPPVLGAPDLVTAVDLDNALLLVVLPP